MYENEKFSLNRLRSALSFSFCSWARVAVNYDSFVANQPTLLARV